MRSADVESRPLHKTQGAGHSAAKKIKVKGRGRGRPRHTTLAALHYGVIRFALKA